MTSLERILRYGASALLGLSCLATALDAQALAPAPVSRPTWSAPPRGKWLSPAQHTVVPGSNPSKECPVGPYFGLSTFLHPPSPGPNDRTFNAIHMALLPQPATHAGLVLAFDGRPQLKNWTQRWSILDPTTDPPTVLWNDELVIQGAGVGDLFCSGHAWMADGRLLVVGGTTWYPAPAEGANLVLIFDPADPAKPYGDWRILPITLANERWYPTVTELPDGKMLVSGGTHAGVEVNSYEVFDPATETLSPPYAGPLGASELLGNYPRVHVLSDGRLLKCGAEPGASTIDPIHGVGGVWTPLAESSIVRHDGSSILFPRDFGKEDRVLVLGGSQLFPHGSVSASVESLFPTRPGAVWRVEPSMHLPRVHLNTLQLPDATVLVLGGNDVQASGNVYWKDAELFTNGRWHLLPEGDSTRDYHSTALLLPDGNVLSAGGDHRDWDYQLFRPHYFDAPVVRPKGVGVSTDQWGYRSSGAGPYTVTFEPADLPIRRVVLIPPGSITHHSDMGARFVDLEIVARAPGAVTVAPPFASGDSGGAPNPTYSVAPPGYYMLFVVTDAGTPSRARFVRLQ